MRVILRDEPFRVPSTFWTERGKFPARWITHPRASESTPTVMAFRLCFELSSKQTVRIHVSGDERYELRLDRRIIGRGPERGDVRGWFYESHDLDLDAGEHTLIARVWALGDLAPGAQISVTPAFMLAVDDPALRDSISTGFAPWETLLIDGIDHLPAQMMFYAGGRIRIRGSAFPWGWDQPDATGFVKPKTIGDAYNDFQQTDQPPYRWLLRPAQLPPMKEEPWRRFVVRHVESPETPSEKPMVVESSRHLSDEADAWTRLLHDRRPLTVPAHSVRRVIIDLDDYVCGYPSLVTSDGAGASIRMHWAESLFDPVFEKNDLAGWWSLKHKGNRDVVAGKYFAGNGDEFVTDGGRRRRFDTLWWSAGRYVELIIRTKDQPLAIDSLSLDQTHYPYAWNGSFESSDPRLAQVIPMAQRVMEMCSHETYMDCPYYEQLMYVGDTRLEVLVGYAWTNDDGLPRKALDQFDRSRKHPGFTQSRYPCRIEQVIPPFSLWWVCMLHDFMMWRGDREFVRAKLPGVHSVLDAFHACINRNGLVEAPNGWNFVDWVKTWRNGMPPDADTGVSGPINFHLIYTLRLASQIEAWTGEPELAAMYGRRADALAAACERFWDESRGLYADNLDRTSWSEHSQCLALLGDAVPADRRGSVFASLVADPTLAQTTVYFSHYLFETYRLFDRVDLLLERMGLWFDLHRLGFRTTIEAPEPSRSDCHAWGAHPIFHYLATICGVRPLAPGFEQVQIAPRLGPLSAVRGTLQTPRGPVSVDLRSQGTSVSGMVQLPEGVKGIWSDGPTRKPLFAGVTAV
jgi:hypothetical protein